MEDNLIGTLSMFRTMGIKPNFSDLARSYGKDRHTIKKMYDGEEKKERRGLRNWTPISTISSGFSPIPEPA